MITRTAANQLGRTPVHYENILFYDTRAFVRYRTKQLPSSPKRVLDEQEKRAFIAFRVQRMKAFVAEYRALHREACRREWRRMELST